MKSCGQMLARALATIVAVASITACVSPAARVPCDGRLEPINLPAKKSEASSKRTEPATRRASP
jgi:hypothetical protein